MDNFVDIVEEVREGPSKRQVAKATKEEAAENSFKDQHPLFTGIQKCDLGNSPATQTRELLNL